MPPRYVRLSGEIAERAILDALRAGYALAIVDRGSASASR